MSTSLYLPAPTQSTAITTHRPSASQPPTQLPKPATKLNAPSYEERCQIAQNPTPNKKPFCPRSLRDFDDGGAFPEIHVAQYPRHMGNPHLAKKKKPLTDGDSRPLNKPAGTLTAGTIINVEIDQDGDVNYDAIVKTGTNANKTVYTRHSDLRGTNPSPEDLALPSPADEKRTADRTAAALQALVSHKVQMARPTGSAVLNAATSANVEQKTEFIKYTPREDAPGYNPAVSQRVIQMVPAQIDPMAPPKHMHKKAPRGPAEDPVPVLHAPPKKLTKEERDKWNRLYIELEEYEGYTIPLDKRLAADGRGLRDASINPKFATLSESLYVAERQAREEVRMRSTVRKRLEVAEKERREQELRDLANKARMERTNTAPPPSSSSHYEPTPSKQKSDDNNVSASEDEGSPTRISDDEALEQRERIRVARKKERERELRLENLKGNAKKQRLEDERDVSEKIALGLHTGTGGALGGQVDSRLYNQSAGMDSGFGADDEYNTYSKPLFDRDAATKSIYRPTAAATTEDPDEQYEKLAKDATTRFQPDTGFAGAEGGNASAGPRSAPVQFEKR
eukprot:CAMPEP_0172521160 /NCGR_PEP_ID=MMETSP1066-20121228/292415_1 /TAXON_ID=671091 /ORGANISM="Coscinodiscus wailesii, Strain CCMP2513" /LENGTH=565 /DNA_ID=CAMNT_0013304023 /DNA_START=69 /DNA_END=1767 /DNA_ORIENTATION=-